MINKVNSFSKSPYFIFPIRALHIILLSLLLQTNVRNPYDWLYKIVSICHTYFYDDIGKPCKYYMNTRRERESHTSCIHLYKI